MERIELEPAYSTVKLPGKCVKCLAEQEYGDCLRQLLKGEDAKKELEERFEAILSLLKSSELKSLRDEAEKQLANGKKVKLIIERNEENEPKYSIEVY
jgi:hypothetical protein